MPEKVPDDLTGPAPRPVDGPVVPLTGAPASAEALLGHSGVQRDPDATATKVLVKGEAAPPIPGRADDFAWPPPQPLAENATIAPPVDSAARPARAPAARRPGESPARTPRGSTPSKGPMQLGPHTQNRADEAARVR
jgi:hypothetical protein